MRSEWVDTLKGLDLYAEKMDDQMTGWLNGQAMTELRRKRQ